MSDQKPEQAKTEQAETDQTLEQAKTNQLQVPSTVAGAEGGKSPDSTESSPKRPKRSVMQSLRKMASPTKSDSKPSACKCESPGNHDAGCPCNQKKPPGNKSPIKTLINTITSGAQNVLDKFKHKKRDSMDEELFDEEAYKTATEPVEEQELDSPSETFEPRLKPFSLSDISGDPFEDKSKSTSVSSMPTSLSEVSSSVFASSVSSPSASELPSTLKKEEESKEEQHEK